MILSDAMRDEKRGHLSRPPSPPLLKETSVQRCLMGLIVCLSALAFPLAVQAAPWRWRRWRRRSWRRWRRRSWHWRWRHRRGGVGGGYGGIGRGGYGGYGGFGGGYGGYGGYGGFGGLGYGGFGGGLYLGVSLTAAATAIRTTHAYASPVSSPYVPSYYGGPGDLSTFNPQPPRQLPPPVPAPVGNTANIRVIYADPNAKLLVDDGPTTSTGGVRVLGTPELTPGQTFHYTLTATWQEGAQPSARSA